MQERNPEEGADGRVLNRNTLAQKQEAYKKEDNIASHDNVREHASLTSVILLRLGPPSYLGRQMMSQGIWLQITAKRLHSMSSGRCPTIENYGKETP